MLTDEQAFGFFFFAFFGLVMFCPFVSFLRSGFKHGFQEEVLFPLLAAGFFCLCCFGMAFRAVG